MENRPDASLPLTKLVNIFEVEAMAQRRLDARTYAEIAGSDRRVFDRITFRPRMMVNTTKLDLTAGAIRRAHVHADRRRADREQKRFHPEGELATARGASAAKAVMVVSDRPVSDRADRAGSEGRLLVSGYPDADKQRLGAGRGGWVQRRSA